MFNPYAISRSEKKSRLAFRCTHRHNGIIHHCCFDQANGLTEKIAILDIETEDLRADYSIAFCWCLLDYDTKKIYHDIINLNDIKKYTSRERNTQPKEDTRIIQSLVEKLSDYDRIIGHYSSLFDIPFIRTRAVIDKVKFPFWGSHWQTDTWRILKTKFKLSRNSLENSHLKLLGFSRKDHLSLSIKHGCLRGEKWALDLTMEHCKKDVLDTEELYRIIEPYARKTKSSI